jgi:hypothetical protein
MFKLIEDRNRIDAFLDKLLMIHNTETAKKQPFICTGAAIQAAKHLIEEEGKYLCDITCIYRWKNISLCIKYEYSGGWGSLLQR